MTKQPLSPNLQKFLADPMNEAMLELIVRKLADYDPTDTESKLPLDEYSLNELSDGGTGSFIAYALGVASPDFPKYLCDQVNILSKGRIILNLISYSKTDRKARFFFTNHKTDDTACLEMVAYLPHYFRRRD